MAEAFIGVDIQGIPQLNRIMTGISEQSANIAVDTASTYLLEVFRTYPPYKHVSRKDAYPETGDGFFSDKQRRWFWANMRDGNIDIPYKRTQGLRRGWKKIGAGRNSILANETPGAAYVMGDEEQARLNKMAGWKTMSVIINERMERLTRMMVTAIERDIRRNGAR